jgi:hypothetical protein
MYSDDEDGFNLPATGNREPTVRLESTVDPDFHIKVEDRTTPENEKVIHFRKNGDRQAQRRAIQAEHDEYDQVIIKMKESGYRNSEIADRLKKLSGGKVDYDSKTLGTRYTRLKQAEADEYDRQLDDELTDWHEGEVRCSRI